MKHIQKLLFLALFLSFTTMACHKDHEDNNAPVITLTSPVQDASISGAVTIAGIVTDESLHEMEISIKRDSDNVELFNATPEVHDLTSYTIAETWTPSGIGAETPVTLTVYAEDHNEQGVTLTVKFKVKP